MAASDTMTLRCRKKNKRSAACVHNNKRSYTIALMEEAEVAAISDNFATLYGSACEAVEDSSTSPLWGNFNPLNFSRSCYFHSFISPESLIYIVHAKLRSLR